MFVVNLGAIGFRVVWGVSFVCPVTSWNLGKDARPCNLGTLAPDIAMILFGEDDDVVMKMG